MSFDGETYGNFYCGSNGSLPVRGTSVTWGTYQGTSAACYVMRFA